MSKDIRVDALVPNDYNPNRMTDTEYAELVVELRHYREHQDQGQRPAPIVVRQGLTAEKYVIVDGEHRWRAAQEVGLDTVPCEIIEVGEFESRRQTYKRNRHGNDNQVRLGRMLDQMQGDRSNRELAEELNVSEGTIRNAQAYLRAAELRNDYAEDQEKADREIALLTVKQVRQYLGRRGEFGIPSDVWYGLRNLWVDYGCNIDLARKHKQYIEAWPTVGDYLVVTQEEQGSARHIDAVPGKMEPRERMLFGEVHTVEEFIPYITPEEWRHVLQQEAQYMPDRFNRPFEAAIEVLKKQKNVPDATSPFVALQRERLKHAPQFIKVADFLTPDEQAFLMDATEGDISSDALEQIKRDITEAMATRDGFRCESQKRSDAYTEALKSGDDKALDAARQAAMDSEMLAGAIMNIEDAWQKRVGEYREDRRLTLRNSMLDDRAMLIKAFVGHIMKDHVFREARIDGEAAALVLERRLNALPWAEVRLLLGLILFPEISPGSLWLKKKTNKESP